MSYRTTVMVYGQPDATKKRCFDCAHCQAAMSWWCVNEEAVAYRGTARIGEGVHSCKFWSPMKHISELSWWRRLLFKWSLFSIAVYGDKPEQELP